MTQEALNQEYFDWMCSLVSENPITNGATYRKLLTYLNQVDFTYTIDMDGNRAEDGIDLRYRFGYERGYSNPMIASYLDIRPCSVLEMMIALAVRCEEHIMEDSEIGNRTGQWFWTMVVSLGLRAMDDRRFNDIYVSKIIERFLDRKYERNGVGGLFTVQHCSRDMRTTEIWYQMCLYLDSIL